ncbi:MAG: HAMP domain-containing sensor histidine kinase [Vicingaceae bacterium]
MNIYSKKQRWKFALAIVAAIIIFVSLWYTNILVREIADEEKNKAKSWAEAIQRKAELVTHTQDLFEKLAEEERKKVEIWAEASSSVVNAPDDNLELYTKILINNTTIPLIRTDENDNISNYRNLDEEKAKDTVFLQKKLAEMKSKNDPVVINYFGDQKNLIYYDESTIFSDLRAVIDQQIESFNKDIVTNSASVPVIYTDSSQQKVLAYGNIDEDKIESVGYITQLIEKMRAINPPIKVTLGDDKVRYIFYDESPLLARLKYYPYVQLGVIALFLLIAYYLFSTARNAEQNQVWVGMAKETAHQLGTPLSSLLAWIEVLRSKNVDEQTLSEIRRDLGRLETITERFSKIGAAPKLEQNDVNQVIENTLKYLKTRLSKKVDFNHTTSNGKKVMASINVPLLEWVLENIVKNAVDAISGEGKIDIHVTDQSQFVYIDISDNGKGIPKGARKTVFQPGYTTKKRGWGLGLSLTKRIIENYHSGKVFVKQSEIGQGTTFRIVLNKVTQNGRNIHSYSLL